MIKFIKSLFVFRVVLPTILLMILVGFFLPTAVHIDGFLSVSITRLPEIDSRYVSLPMMTDDPLFGWPFTILGRYGPDTSRSSLVINPIGLILNLLVFMITIKVVLFIFKKSENRL